MEGLSKLYVCKKGLLRCGEPNKFTSIVNGVYVDMKMIDKEIHYDILFKNSLGVRCHGYLFSCKSKYHQKINHIKFN